MGAYLARRLLATVPVIVGVSIVVFAVMQLVPGDVVLLRLSEAPGATQADVDALREELGLDRPKPLQYALWLRGVVQGDLGNSLWTNKPILGEIAKKVPVSLELAVLSAGFSIVLGVGAGVVSAVFSGRFIDYLTRVFMTLGMAVPNFALATITLVALGMFFAWSPGVWYHPLTEDPMANLQQMFLPALILGFSLSASIARMTRSAMLEVLRQDYVRTARSKGLSERKVILRHALQNAMPPVVTIIGLQFGFLMSGAVVIESIFGLPGMGRFMLDAISRRDYTTVQSAVLLVSVVYVLINVLVDISYGWLDPRIRYS